MTLTQIEHLHRLRHSALPDTVVADSLPSFRPEIYGPSDLWLCEIQRRCRGLIRGTVVPSVAWALRATGSVQFIYEVLSATGQAGAYSAAVRPNARDALQDRI